LEDANIKLGSVLSDMFGVSGQRMLQALVQQDTPDSAEIAKLAHWRLKPKMEAIKQSLEGKLSDHYRFLIDLSMQHMRVIEEQLIRLDQEIQRRLQPYQEEYALLQTTPAIKEAGTARILPRLAPTCPPFPMETICMGRCVSRKQRERRQKVSEQDPQG
jgi:hypothetical protein